MIRASEAREIFGSIRTMSDKTGICEGTIESWIKRGDAIPAKHRSTVKRAAIVFLGGLIEAVDGWG